MKNIILIPIIILITCFACKKKIDKRQTYLGGKWVLTKFLVNGNDSTKVQKAKKNYADYYIIYWEQYIKKTSGTGWVLYADNSSSNYYTNLDPSSDYSSIGFLHFNFNLKDDSLIIVWKINTLTNDEFQIESNYNGNHYVSHYNRN